MKRWMGWTLALGLLISLAAVAGGRWSQGISIYTWSGGGYAEGDLSTVRGDSSSTDFIYCDSVFNSQNNTWAAECGAGQGSTYYYCYTTNQNLALEAASVGSDGVLEFEWDSTGTCDYISVSHGSPYAPKPQ